MENSHEHEFLFYSFHIFSSRITRMTPLRLLLYIEHVYIAWIGLALVFHESYTREFILFDLSFSLSLTYSNLQQWVNTYTFFNISSL